MRWVSGIVPIDTRKSKIFLDGEFAFVLYKSECTRFGLKEDEELSPEIYEAISGVLHKRALNRAVYLLKDRDYTEKQLENKLCESGYPKNIVDNIMERMKEYGYINDYNYAKRFIGNKSHLMSRRELEYKLLEKLVAKDIIKQALAETLGVNEEDAERQAFFNFYRKKNVNYEQLDMKEKQKLIGYFLRKGFLYDNIVSYLHEIEKNN